MRRANRTRSDLIVLVILYLLCVALAAGFDGFEKLYQLSRAHETLQVDEIFSGLIIGAILVSVFAFRRVADLDAGRVTEPTSEEQFRNIVESIPIGLHFYRLEPNGRLVFAGANPAADRILGVDNSRFVGQRIEEAFPPLADTEVPERYREVAKGAEPWNTEQVDYSHGAIQGAFAVHAFRIAPGSMVAAFEDITDRKRTEEALRESEATFHSTFEHAPIGKALVAPDGRLLRVNPALCRLVGYSADEMLARTLLDLSHPDDRTAHLDCLQRTLASDPAACQFEKRWLHRNGQVMWMRLNSSLVRNEQGQPLHFITQVQDMTDSKRMLDELRESEAKYRTTVANIPGVVYRAFPDWTAEFMGDLEGVSGYTVDELNALDGAWRSVVHPDDREAVERDGAVLLQRPTSIVQAYRIITKDDAVRWVEDRKTSLFSPTGSFEELRGIVLDVTERKLLENQLRQAQKMEAVGQLTGGLAHDFNNILTVVIGNAEVMASALPTDSAVQEDLAELLTAAKRGATMISRLLQFSRRGTLAMTPVRPGTVVSSLGAMLRRLLPATVRLELTDATAESDMVLADTGAMEQILVNLCTNARDAMPTGGTLRIECERTWLDEGYHATHPWVTPGAYISVTVTDSGTGMDEETKRKLFEPFFTTKPASKGTGLGMAMVYGLMKQHNGMVHVYSELGQGTTMKLYFPAAPEAATEAAAARRVSDPKQVAGGTETILLAEDEPAIRRTTKRALEGKGYTVLMAEDGEQALELYGKNKDDVALVISDLVMPKLGGRQLAEALRQDGSWVPILFTSGYSPGSGYRDGEFPAGVEFLQKPWTLTDLFTRVRELLDG